MAFAARGHLHKYDPADPHAFLDSTLALDLHKNNPDIEPVAIALYEKYAMTEPLRGPTDAHTSEHYMQLYVLAHRLQDETLQNNVMDLVRRFYAAEKMTASPGRLEYIYHAIPVQPAMMKRFLITTTAFRLLTEASPEDHDQIGHPIFLAGSMQNLLIPQMSLDLIEALVWLSRADKPDVRLGSSCA